MLHEPLAVNLIQGSAVLLIFFFFWKICPASHGAVEAKGWKAWSALHPVRPCRSGGWEPGAKLASHPESARYRKGGATERQILEQGLEQPSQKSGFIHPLRRVGHAIS